VKWGQNFDGQRSGMDHLGIFIGICAVFFWVLGAYLWQPLIWAGWVLIMLTYVRSFSKNKLRRHQENIRFLKYWYPVQSNLTNRFRKYRAKREHRHFKCKECRQKLRVPRKLRRVQVTCPKCRETFVKESLQGKILRMMKR